MFVLGEMVGAPWSGALEERSKVQALEVGVAVEVRVPFVNGVGLCVILMGWLVFDGIRECNLVG